MTAEEREEWHRDQEALAREATEGHARGPGATETGERVKDVPVEWTLTRRVREAEAKVARVEALHVRRGLPDHHRTDRALAVAPDRCSTCWGNGNYEVWPCPTIRALADAPAEQRAEQRAERREKANECGDRWTTTSGPPCVLPRDHKGPHSATSINGATTFTWDPSTRTEAAESERDGLRPAEQRAEGGA